MQKELRTVRVGPARLHHLNEAEVISLILSSLEQGLGGWLVNPNVDVLRQMAADPELRGLVDTATLRIADGAPLEWAARLSGQRLPPRVPGANFIWTLSAAAATAGRTVFLLGGAPGVASRAADALREAAPTLAVAGTHSPPWGFENDEAAQAVLRDHLLAADPDIVFCGLGFPKQERLMSALTLEFPSTWFIGSGASIAFAAGDIPRAATWMSRLGIEWIFRLVSEPRRLAHRYIVDDIPYALTLMADSYRTRRFAREQQR